jgi:kinesin family protein 1
VLAALSPGSRLTFTVSVDCVKGLNSEDFASVHAQTRLSSLVGPSIASEDTFASLPVDLDKTSVAHLSLKRTVTVIVTPEMTPYLREEYATIEFFAKVRPAYLSRLERWDRTREVSPPSSSPGTPLRPGETRPAMRRNETDFVQPEHHDVLAKIEIRELAADGEHYPAEVVDGVIHLHQGLQRRLFVHLTHTSGKSLPWTKLGHVSTGDVRLVDKIGQITSVAKGEVGVKLNSEVEHRPDGTSVLSGIGGWDSAAHNSIHLNRKTSGDQRLLIRLLFLVEVETLDEPAVFSMDLPIRILARDTKRSSFLTFWSANKIFTSLTSIFAVDLSPPLARSAADLWVLDTGKKHVRGEERLGDWKPRSLSLLEDWGRMRGRQKRLGDVQATRAVLGMWREPGDSGAGPGSGWGSGSESRVEDLEEPPTKSAPAAAAQEREELLKRCLHLWQQAMEYRLQVGVRRRQTQVVSTLAQESADRGLIRTHTHTRGYPWLALTFGQSQVDVQRASAGEEAVARKMRRLLPDLEPKLVPTVKQLPRSESVIRSGVLMLLRDSQANQWDKLHFVLRRWVRFRVTFRHCHDENEQT